jgi:hypothetical protein
VTLFRALTVGIFLATALTMTVLAMDYRVKHRTPAAKTPLPTVTIASPVDYGAQLNRIERALATKTPRPTQAPATEVVIPSCLTPTEMRVLCDQWSPTPIPTQPPAEPPDPTALPCGTRDANGRLPQHCYSTHSETPEGE